MAFKKHSIKGLVLLRYNVLRHVIFLWMSLNHIPYREFWYFVWLWTFFQWTYLRDNSQEKVPFGEGWGKHFVSFFPWNIFVYRMNTGCHQTFKSEQQRWLCQHHFVPKVSSFPKQCSCQLTSLVTATFRHFNKRLLFTLSGIISFLCIACSRWIYL